MLKVSADRGKARRGLPGAMATFSRYVYETTRHPLKAWAVLCLSLTVTYCAWYVSGGFVAKRGMDRFHFETEDIKSAIGDRMRDQEKALRGGVGLFATSPQVTRKQWMAYVDSLDIERQYPGLQGFGFSLQLRPGDLEAHIRSVRAEGFPDYTVRPPGQRPVYTSIIYLEPFNWRNQRAFGYDMFSEANRRAAMERARDTGEPAVTRMVRLVQETDKDVQRGFLMYLPVYRNGAPRATVAERQAALVGYVYSPFRMNDLMRGILGAGNADIHLEIYDGETISPATLLYDSRPDEESPATGDSHIFQITTTLDFGGAVWTLRLTSDDGFISSAEASQPYLVAAGALIIDALVFFMIGSVSRQHRRAEALAHAMTAELRQQTARTQAVLDTILEGIITIDDNGIISSFNPAAATIFGYASDEVIGRNVNILMPEPYRSAHDGYLRSFLKTGNAKPVGIGRELEGLRADGSRFPMELAVSSMMVGDNQMFTGVVRDITERKRVDKIKDEFVSVVSHELRTPLTSLRGSLGLLSSESLGSLPGKAKTLLDIAYRNASRLALLVNDILDIEKLSSNTLEFNLAVTEAGTLAQQAIDDNAAYGAEHQVRFRVQRDAEAAYINVDEHRILQVLANLLSNAAKYAPAGSEVVVRISRDNGRVRFSVIDHGPGIPKDKQAQLFDRFFQVDSSDSRSKQGTGLGLAIVKSILEKHGAEIRVASEVDKGSTFFFDLEEVDAPAEDGSGSAGRKRERTAA